MISLSSNDFLLVKLQLSRKHLEVISEVLYYSSWSEP